LINKEMKDKKKSDELGDTIKRIEKSARHSSRG